MGAAGVLRLRWTLRWTLPPAALGLFGSGVLYSSKEKNQNNRQLLQPEPKSYFSTSAKRDNNDVSNKTSSACSNSGSSFAHNGDTGSIWAKIMQKFAGVKQTVGSPEWTELDNIKNYITPDWGRLLPPSVQKLQRELSMAPGSLADDIWKEARDPDINPEILLEAKVRVGDSLCDEELAFRRERQVHTVKALASYLNIPENDIHPDDIPIIAMCGSGGGLRALVAGTGSYLATQEAGLWDCVTYTAGVSGSCWLQTLYHSSITGRDFHRLVDHLKNRLGVHLAFPPKALNLLTTAPTNKYLLSGLVEKLKGNPGADFGLVDIYGMLLAARLLVPKGHLGVSDQDLKLSNQRYNIYNGAHPMPIYTAVRHEIPVLDKEEDGHHKERPTPEKLIKESQIESWFQWFEFTPYEFFCEELSAGIPTWALGRHFDGGTNLIPNGEFPVPELRVPGLMGIWGSAFCATLSHYYKEIRPLLQGIAGFGGIDSLIQGKTKDLIRVHPIDPATIPNYVLGMKDQLPPSCPESIFRSKHLRLMDAGMSNNLPIYPLLRSGRDVDIIISFDASADIKRENWLLAVDGYARQRGVKGWPVGAGWPREDTNLEEAEKKLQEPQNIATNALNKKIKTAQNNDKNTPSNRVGTPKSTNVVGDRPALEDTDLGYCNVWVGTTQERVSGEEPPPSKRLFHPQNGDHSESNFHLMRPDAGIAVVYFPLLPNPSAPQVPQVSSLSKSPVPAQLSEKASSANGSDSARSPKPQPSTIHPDVDDFLSTWNFVYTPEQIDSVVGLAKANFAQGEGQVKRVVRAVYERKKSDRLRREEQETRRRLEGFVPI